MRRLARRAVTLALCIAVMVSAPTYVAQARDPGEPSRNKATKPVRKPGDSGGRRDGDSGEGNSGNGNNRNGGGSGRGGGKAEPACDEACRNYKREVERYRRQAASYKQRAGLCQDGRADAETYAKCLGRAPTAPRRPGSATGEADPGRGGTPPVIDPEVLAISAVATLYLPDSTPIVGPPPEINEWMMAVVGYPLWLWTPGQDKTYRTSVRSDGITLTLTGRAVQTVFDMGDRDWSGTSGWRAPPVVCNQTTQWTRGVAAMAPSPTCGYTYQFRSTSPTQRRQAYQLSARVTWQIDWAATGAIVESGTFPVSFTDTTTLVVGELQVVRTR